VLKIRIENFDRLPDGGPLEYSVDRRGFDFGRDSHLDWTLPDKSRVISGKHCEIRFYDDAYWLIDVSTNGTFLNGSTKRVQTPYQLNEGDRLQVGEYLLSVNITLPPQRQAPFVQSTPASRFEPPPRSNIWDAGGSAPPPLDARELMPKPLPADIAPDYLHQALLVPEVETNDVIQRPQVSARSAWNVDSDLSSPSLSSQQGAPAQPSGPVPPISNLQPAAASVESNAKRFAKSFAEGAGLPAGALDHLDDAQLAEASGRLLKQTCQQLMELLSARAEAKAISRNADRTMIKATENNPLKFMPTPEEALQVMLSPRGKGYLNAQETLESSFSDLKRHHFALLAAMQATVVEFFNELSPDAVEKSSGARKSLLGGGKGKLWDDLASRWADKSRKRENGMLDAFLDSFAEHYEELGKLKK
jgi:type VI secretion system protein ImpI